MVAVSCPDWPPLRHRATQPITAKQALVATTPITNWREGAKRRWVPSSRSSNRSASVAAAFALTASPSLKNSVSNVSKWRLPPSGAAVEASIAGSPLLLVRFI
jgi:hypothetical protein